MGKKRDKTYQIHQNRLKAYHKQDRVDENNGSSSSDELTEAQKRKYIKNSDNPRWNNQNTNKKRKKTQKRQASRVQHKQAQKTKVKIPRMGAPGMRMRPS